MMLSLFYEWIKPHYFDGRLISVRVIVSHISDKAGILGQPIFPRRITVGLPTELCAMTRKTLYLTAVAVFP
jgi:hypothetical protein